MALQPLSVQGQIGLGIAAGGGSLGPAPRVVVRPRGRVGGDHVADARTIAKELWEPLSE